eukprot:990134_1
MNVESISSQNRSQGTHDHVFPSARQRRPTDIPGVLPSGKVVRIYPAAYHTNLESELKPYFGQYVTIVELSNRASSLYQIRTSDGNLLIAHKSAVYNPWLHPNLPENPNNERSGTSPLLGLKLSWPPTVLTGPKIPRSALRGIKVPPTRLGGPNSPNITTATFRSRITVPPEPRTLKGHTVRPACPKGRPKSLKRRRSPVKKIVKIESDDETESDDEWMPRIQPEVKVRSRQMLDENDNDILDQEEKDPNSPTLLYAVGNEIVNCVCKLYAQANVSSRNTNVFVTNGKHMHLSEWQLL